MLSTQCRPVASAAAALETNKSDVKDKAVKREKIIGKLPHVDARFDIKNSPTYGRLI